jgi:hypothetical protein
MENLNELSVVFMIHKKVVKFGIKWSESKDNDHSWIMLASQALSSSQQ